jgi:hypothetical protein
MKGVCTLWLLALTSKYTYIKIKFAHSVSSLQRCDQGEKYKFYYLLTGFFFFEMICWLVLREISKIIRSISIYSCPLHHRRKELLY